MSQNECFIVTPIFQGQNRKICHKKYSAGCYRIVSFSSGITRIRNMMIIQWIHLLSKILLVSVNFRVLHPIFAGKIIIGFEGSILGGKSEAETMVFTIKYIRCSCIFVPLNQSSGDWYIELVYPLVNVYITNWNITTFYR